MKKTILCKWIQYLLNTPSLLFLPFLLIYFFSAFYFSAHLNDGDSLRYQFYAQNIASGFFTNKQCIDIWNGPGYPILLSPIFLFNLPVLSIVALNAILYYISVVFLYKVILEISSKYYALVFGGLWACYYPNGYFLSVGISEIFTITLVVLFCFFSVRSFDSKHSRKTWSYASFAGLFFGLLVLTKVIFGYIFPIIFLCLFSSYVLFKFQRRNVFKLLFITTIGFGVCLPWLTYTYNITGKLFFWAAAGSENLYWMTVENQEMGGIQKNLLRCKNTKSFNWDLAVRKFDIEALEKSSVLKAANEMSQMESCEFIKQKAIENIKNHPTVYIKNFFSNTLRFFFLPSSGKYQWYGIMHLLPSALIFVLFILSLPLALINFYKLSMVHIYLIAICLVYIFGSLLLSAIQRQFLVVQPMFFVWISYIFSNTLHFVSNFSRDK